MKKDLDHQTNNSIETLSNIVVYNKYAKYLPNKKRRETWNEIIDRYLTMIINKYSTKKDKENLKKFNKSFFIQTGRDSNFLDLIISEKFNKKEYSEITYKIIKHSSYLYNKKILPSMRALQFAGPAIEKNEARIYNCSYLPVDDYRAFSETMFLLLGGTGVGYSVQYNHVNKLSEIQKPTKEAKFLIGDSIEGWADAVKQLMKSYLGKTKVKPRFDFSDIREKGSLLITAGGKAPGPDPLKIALVKIESILNSKNNGDKLSPIECHDIMCHIADAVLAGGIRRAALISLFSFDDKEMATCKHGNWWENNPQRGRANNSAVILRNRVKSSEFFEFTKLIEDSGSGEPGIYFTDDPEYGTNPLIEKSTNIICILN